MSLISKRRSYRSLACDAANGAALNYVCERNSPSLNTARGWSDCVVGNLCEIKTLSMT